MSPGWARPPALPRPPPRCVPRWSSALAPFAQAVEGEPRPRVLALEWFDPPFVGGHWVPGDDRDRRRHRRDRHPRGEVPYGGVGRARRRQPRSGRGDALRLGRDSAPARRPRRTATSWLRWEPSESCAVDAAASFSRPGPRLVEGTELLAHLMHPDRVAAPNGVSFHGGQLRNGHELGRAHHRDRGPVDTCFDAIVDYESFPGWQDAVDSVEVLSRTADGLGENVRLFVDAKVRKIDYTLRYSYTAPPRSAGTSSRATGCGTSTASTRSKASGRIAPAPPTSSAPTPRSPCPAWSCAAPIRHS